MPLTKEETDTVLAVTQTIVDIVAESEPLGSPAGHLYVALQMYGFTHAHCDLLFSILRQAGKLRVEHHVYHLAEGAKRHA
jgi:hypothetical protein